MRHYLFIWMLLASGCAFAQGPIKEIFMCKEASLRLTAESVGAVSYEWFHDNELITGSTSSELVVNKEGTYKALGINSDGCPSQESIYIVVKNHTPLAVDDIAVGKINTDMLLDVLLNDESVCAALNPATLSVTEPPANGAVYVVNGKFSFHPPTDFEGNVTFSYTVSDQAGQQSNVGNVKLEILKDPLPVKLVYFQAKKNENQVRLTWETAEETNSDHFDIERSADMKLWAGIGSVLAASDSETAREYVLADTLPEPGLNYYRLKMVDHDNSFSLSSIRSVHFQELSWAELFPNPVDDQLRVMIRNKKIKSMRLISNAGIVRLSRPVLAPSFTISMKEFPTGMYYIHFEQDDGAVKIFKLMHN
ncbi:Ig-like domain-containing protein [Dyadobacter sp. MSC1_007]|jgi:hypothetical protein|uniref:Ig-like domain-containing protein n=1 Tax=Dyadobacter sp. MSC1_007 TaxID=2909264 RepID=UPI00202E5421|nr:Ig-like domain-containing protein [Dyadobacter sp. MSC1_007]